MSGTVFCMARPQKPHHQSWDNRPVMGLAHDRDGRWRVIATGQKFSEPDERKAIARFYTMIAPAQVAIPTMRTNRTNLQLVYGPDGKGTFHREMDESLLWDWFRDQIKADAQNVAKRTGIPEIAHLQHLALPQEAIRLEKLMEVYREKNPSTDRTKQEAIAVMNRLIKATGAKTLADLTQERLIAFHDQVESSGTLKSAGTRITYYSRIKTIISFGLKVGMDQVQLRAALDRCKVLWTPELVPHVKPNPISRAHFHTLLEKGGDEWRAWLLLAMNLCMTFEDLCELRWDDFDLKRGTYAAIRVKTRRKRIPRVAVLWRESLAALRVIARKGPYVFVSSHGTRFNRNTRVNRFAELREAAGLPDSLKFNNIRDGSYGAACDKAPDERWARVLAGHHAAGLQDNYVLRNPEGAKPACDAIYQVYGPF
jgi:integrase